MGRRRMLGPGSGLLRGVLFSVIAAAVTYAVAVRPRIVRWGAADDEIEGQLPGDELIEDAMSQTTRAITISAPVSEVWPWLIQLGEGKGGLYSYDAIENMMGRDSSLTYEIRPEWQDLAVGDTVKLAPGDGPVLEVAVLEPYESLVLRGSTTEAEDGEPAASELGASEPPAEEASTGEPMTDEPAAEEVATDEPTTDKSAKAEPDYEFTWAFVLREVNPLTTRLVVRGRGAGHPRELATGFGLALEPFLFLLEEKMLRGIKKRAEGLRLPAETASEAPVAPAAIAGRTEEGAEPTPSLRAPGEEPAVD